MLRIIMFVPRLADSARWWKECVEYCQPRGYQVVAVVARLEDLRKAALLHHATMVVVARRAHLLPELPIEVVSEADDQKEAKRSRRPQRRSSVPPQ